MGKEKISESPKLEKMTIEDINKIKKAHSKEIWTNLFCCIMGVVFFALSGGEGLALIFNPIIYFFLYFLYKLLIVYLFDDIYKDFNEQQKIKITLIVNEKERPTHINDESENLIRFKKNKYFGTIGVSDSSSWIAIGSKVDIELSNHGKYIISMTCKKENVEYRGISRAFK